MIFIFSGLQTVAVTNYCAPIKKPGPVVFISWAFTAPTPTSSNRGAKK